MDENDMSEKKLINAAKGVPAFSLTAIANHAFQKTSLPGYQAALEKAFESIAAYFAARGFGGDRQAGALGRESVLATSGGTTEGFKMIVDLLANDLADYKHRSGQHIHPVIVMPTPTYGVFFDYPRSKGIDVVTVDRDMDKGGQLDPQALDRVLGDLAAQGKRAVAYYDANPHNPLGLVRGRAETEALATVLKKHSDAYAAQDRLEAGQKAIPVWNGAASRIRTIDDMVADGLEYGAEHPFSFGQLPHCFKDAFALFGTSKVGPFDVKAGAVIANPADIRALKSIRHAGYTKLLPESVFMMEAYFNKDEPFALQRQSYLSGLCHTHELRGKFMKALINGKEAASGITGENRRWMIETLMAHKGLSRRKALERLNEGIPGIKIVTAPQAGFFHLLDFSALRSALAKTGASPAVGLSQMFGKAALEFRPGEKIGIAADDLIVRATFAMPEEDIIELADRLSSEIKALRGPALK